MITDETVKHVAKMARLELNEADSAQYTADLSKIMTLVDELSSLPMEDVDAMADALPTVFRDDVVLKPLTRDALMANAPHEEDGFFRVPKILDE